MKVLFAFILIFIVAVKIEGQIPAFGRCSNKFRPMKDFQKVKFMGRWYEVERFYAMRDLVATCIAVDYDRFEDGKIFVTNTYTNRLTNRRETMSGKFKLTSGESRGVFNVRYDLLPSFLNFDALPDFIQSYNSTITVLHTDYDNFAILWSCRRLTQYGSAENAWLLTRDQFPNEEVIQSAYGYLDKFGLRNLFIKSSQENCEP